MTSQELTKEIEGDISGKFEKQLESAIVYSLNKLEQEGKMSKQEIGQLYHTNFKKLFSGKVDTANILLSKMDQVSKLKNKILTDRVKNNPESVMSLLKDTIYGALDINTNIKENNLAKNITKGVIDEILSLPEMLLELLKAPIDFAKGLKTALIDNLANTLKSIGAQYTNVLQGIQTAEKAYQTGRSLTLIIMTFIPGATGKALANIGKNLSKSVGNLGGVVIKKELKTLSKQVSTTGIKKELKTLSKETSKNFTEDLADVSSS